MVVATVVALMLAGCAGGGDTSSRPAPSAVRGEATPPERRIANTPRAVSVVTPSNWRVARRRLTPSLTNPRELISVGTGPMVRQTGSACHHMPGASLDAMGPTGAFLSIQEWRGAREDVRLFPGRTRALRLDRPPTRGWVCARSARVRVWWMPFRERGRAFYALAGAGPRAPAATIRLLALAVTSIRIGAPPAPG